MKITDIRIAQGGDLERFEDHLNKMISDGWQPLGPATFHRDTIHDGRWVITMVRYAAPKAPKAGEPPQG